MPGVQDPAADQPDVGFRLMDDMEPVAPFDNISPPAAMSILSPVMPMPGEHHDTLYIAPHHDVDAFPRVAGATCVCEVPKREEVTDAQKEWQRRVARQLGIKVAQMPKPLNPRGAAKCDCAPAEQSAEAPRWFNIDPIHNSRKFKLSPADATYPAGDHWTPKLLGGLSAPEDKLPLQHYPLQAVNDAMDPKVPLSTHDHIDFKFARYVDQLDNRLRGCAGDAVSARCVTECNRGDQVQVVLGSTFFDAKVMDSKIGGAVIIEFVPAAARGATTSIECPIQAMCSEFRYCRRPGAWCVESAVKHTRDVYGNLLMTRTCPPGTEVCRTVTQSVGGGYVYKDGKACKAKGGGSQQRK